jgi:GDPmannose 4,6-dehydratase
MWLMLQQDQADDYVVGTGETHTVEEFVRIAFDHVGLDWRQHVVIDPKFFRPAEVDLLHSDPNKARRMGWGCEVSFEQLVKMMVDADVATLSGQPPVSIRRAA